MTIDAFAKEAVLKWIFRFKRNGSGVIVIIENKAYKYQNGNEQMVNIKQHQFENHQKALAKKVKRVNAKDKRDIVR